MSKNKYSIAIFDMDGTVLDTVEDLRDALNFAFREAGYKANFTLDDAKQCFGSGVEVAIKRALSIIYGAHKDTLVDIGTEKEVLLKEVTEEKVEEISKIYRPYYDSHCDIKTGPYAGIKELIVDLRRNGVLTAVVSNKPDEAVRKLVFRDFYGLFNVYIGEKNGIKRKPAPDMVDKAIESLSYQNDVIADMQLYGPFSIEFLNVLKNISVYIGDSEIDILTAKNSNLDSISVTWGFRSKDFLLRHGAERLAESPDDLRNIILGE